MFEENTQVQIHPNPMPQIEQVMNTLNLNYEKIILLNILFLNLIFLQQTLLQIRQISINFWTTAHIGNGEVIKNSLIGFSNGKTDLSVTECC